MGRKNRGNSKFWSHKKFFPPGNVQGERAITKGREIERERQSGRESARERQREW